MIPRPTYTNSEPSYSIERLRSNPSLVNIGSRVTFSCIPSYYSYSSEPLTSTCLSNGTWSRVADCVKHPCWDKLPARPLNGRREVKLVLGALSGMTTGSHVNFTCNQYYDRVGPATVFCVNGQWDRNIPLCTPSKNVCKKRPWSAIPNGFLLTLKRVDYQNEIDYTRSENATVMISANYACYPGFRFEQYKNIELKSMNNQVVVTQSVSCVNEESWEFSPNCVRG